MFLPVSGILCDANGRVQACRGSRLRYNGRILAQRLQTDGEVTRILGKPDLTRTELDLGSDSPIVRHYYFREYYAVEIGIVNDAYIQKRLPLIFQRFLSGRICRVRVSSYCEPIIPPR